jgi:hypothetical protein
LEVELLILACLRKVANTGVLLDASGKLVKARQLFDSRGKILNCKQTKYKYKSD